MIKTVNKYFFYYKRLVQRFLCCSLTLLMILSTFGTSPFAPSSVIKSKLSLISSITKLSCSPIFRITSFILGFVLTRHPLVIVTIRLRGRNGKCLYA
ncbi:hypothetical protein NBO_65g0011 [Nosema bombycis CQ1]|uniref:Uncharacterized protein n=1 Tax=Nosema bombycis (strain CQ1 / CVCC 102059) TaxID=578461 RepID=R0KTP5_NOSB1|nr:hypothetical protein NBO_65g0011 [Nosema bombycis CQ1]|eukprot:EOB13607.1 hypothetical protein NBO_65g0011 [Nosema bombycis CQ1]